VTFAPNATLGLYLAFLALDVEPGSEVLIPSYTFYGSATAAVFAGLKPVFVDCDATTFNSGVEHFKKALTPKTRVIMPVHIYGQCCDMTAIMDFAQEHNLLVLEDAAQALGAKHKGKQAGTFGDIGVISFYSDKTITTGEGGMLMTQDEALQAKISLLRNQGRPNAGTFIHPSLGMNFRITDIQAAIGRVQLKKFDAIYAGKVHKWKFYENALKGVGDLKFMAVHPDSNLVAFRFPIISAHRDGIMKALQDNGIQTRGFFYPMHLQPKLRSEPAVTLPNSEMLYAQGQCLPIHFQLKDSDLQFICDTIKEYFKHAKG
jgi:perosamine synthetase